MPGFNGTGPAGNGPKTGRGRGRCSANIQPQQGQRPGGGAGGMGTQPSDRQTGNGPMRGGRGMRRGGRNNQQ